MNLFSYDNSIDTIKLNNYIEKVREEFKDDTSYFKILFVDDKEIKTDKYLRNKKIENSIELDTAKFFELLNYEYKNSLAYNIYLEGVVCFKIQIENNILNKQNFIDDNFENVVYSRHQFFTNVIFDAFKKSTTNFIVKSNNNTNFEVELNVLFIRSKNQQNFSLRGHTTLGSEFFHSDSKTINNYKIELSLLNYKFNQLSTHYKYIFTSQFLEELSKTDLSNFKNEYKIYFLLNSFGLAYYVENVFNEIENKELTNVFLSLNNFISQDIDKKLKITSFDIKLNITDLTENTND